MRYELFPEAIQTSVVAVTNQEVPEEDHAVFEARVLGHARHPSHPRHARVGRVAGGPSNLQKFSKTNTKTLAEKEKLFITNKTKSAS